MSLTNRAEGVLDMSIYSLLKGEHAEFTALFKALQVTPDMMDDSKEALFNKLRRELLSHAKAEQKTVYEVVRARIPNSDVDEALMDHQEIEQNLVELSTLDITSDAWDESLKKLEEAVDEHATEEEDILFVQMQDAFSDEEAEEMAQRFHEAKNAELEAIH